MAYQPTTQMTQVTQMNTPAGTIAIGAPRPWKHAIVTWYFPCITYGQNKTQLEPSASCFWNGLIYCVLDGMLLCWIPAAENRGAIRARYNIEGSGCGDCMAHFCCACCALVQEARELKG
ncbi:9299_t:CDS:2 [Diversispora eburnea]|uniref:9299_t:CDS:1 n=1 Tax=Diversispora eburnea TaxID=1213867 RepID=A0A9N9A1X7_9GLOM|nr:9299_t:CDS:2 [Diversispora eburnea]